MINSSGLEPDYLIWLEDENFLLVAKLENEY
jgi:hypothetical protein